MKLRHILQGAAFFGAVAAGAPAWLPGTAEAAACTLNDVNLTIVYPPSVTYTPSSCANSVNGGNSDPTTETSAFNTKLGTNFVYLDKTDAASGTGIGGGIVFTVTAPGTSSGNYTVTWVDTNAILPPNLPLTMDLGIYLKGGNADDAGYVLKDVLISNGPNSGTGEFAITFLNNGGQVPGLSHLTLLGAVTSTPVPVPEPMTLALFGAALLGLGTVLRLRKR